MVYFWSQVEAKCEFDTASSSGPAGVLQPLTLEEIMPHVSLSFEALSTAVL